MKATKVTWYDGDEVVEEYDLPVVDGRYSGTDVLEGDFTGLAEVCRQANLYEATPCSSFTITFVV